MFLIANVQEDQKVVISQTYVLVSIERLNLNLKKKNKITQNIAIRNRYRKICKHLLLLLYYKSVSNLSLSWNQSNPKSC